MISVRLSGVCPTAASQWSGKESNICHLLQVGEQEANISMSAFCSPSEGESQKQRAHKEQNRGKGDFSFVKEK